jgi:membrane protein YdbS with pleckstrin-like domain
MAGDWLHPSPRLRTVRRLEVGVMTAILAAAAGLIAASSGAGTLAVALVASAIVAGIAADRIAQRRVSAWGYCEREDDLLVRRGVMFRRLSVVPYGRMQFVDVTAGPVERSFGLATVQLHTAAASSDARIPGLAATEAARLRDQLARLGEARAAGL